MQSPWYKTTFSLSVENAELIFHVPHDVFSTQRIDEGTLLLLANLPEKMPGRVLDMGCGYGALGIPVASLYPAAQIELVDRDLLAVDWARQNAQLNNLKNVQARGSLGFENLGEAKPVYDWILCNVPARIGTPFMRNLLQEGMARLNPEGELRIVVIRDLGPVLQALSETEGWPLRELARGARHLIFSLSHLERKAEATSATELYFRDEVKVQNLNMIRPFDLGGDDPQRLRSGLPVLWDAFPRQTAPSRVFCFRVGYGQIPLVCAARWPSVEILASDRDLLGLKFTKINADLLGYSDRVNLLPAPSFTEVLKNEKNFSLIVGELSPSAGEAVALQELSAIADALSPEGEGIILCLEKIEKEWLKQVSPRASFRLQTILKREGYAAMRVNRNSDSFEVTKSGTLR